MKLVACPSCHAQYDVTSAAVEHFACRCGQSIAARALAAVERPVERCSSCGALVAPDAANCAYCSSSIVRAGGLRSLLCPECFARNADDARFCTSCGIAFRPQPIPGPSAELLCPCCRVAMAARGIADIDLHECLECHGLWVPEGKLDVLVQRALEARRKRAPGELPRHRPQTVRNPAEQPVLYRKCPSCDELMHRKNYLHTSGVIMDVCVEHGIWLDVDELEQIGAYILSGGLIQAQAREREAQRDAERKQRAGHVRQQIEERWGTTTGSHAPNKAGALGSMLDLLRDLLS